MKVDNDGLWSGERRSFGKTDENGDFFKNSYKTLLTFFNKDIEMFKINKSLKLK